jgi:putative ABC transport system permease protein
MTNAVRSAIRLFSGGGARAARLAPPAIRPALEREAAETIEDVCTRAFDTGGWPALVWHGAAECLDVARRGLAARLGQDVPLTIDRPRARRAQGRQLMLIDDLRHGLRRLRARPAVVVTAAGMLALGVGLTTTMFTLADSLLLRPVPFRDPGRLAELEMRTEHGGRTTVSPPVLRAWQTSPVFASVQGVTGGVSLIEGAGGLVARASALATPGLFDMLGVRPIRGRLFTADEGRAGLDDRVLLSETLWRGAFGADPALVGRRITVDGQSMLVVGILPADFRFPEWNTVLWRPIDYQTPPPRHATDRPSPYVRTATNVPEADALRVAADLARAADPTVASQWVQANALAGIVLNPYYQRAIPLLIGAVALVFLILCANVSSLLLAQFTARRREFSVCTALGASRFRLVREALVESGLLGLVGAGGGIALAWVLVSASRGFVPEALAVHTLNPVSLDARALAVALAAGLVATVAAGVLPAWMGTRGNPAGSLRLAERGGTESRPARRATRAMLVAEIALACTLLAGAALLVRSFVNLAGTDRGLDTHGVLTTWLSLPPASFADKPARLSATSAVDSAIRALPGIARVALSYGVPPEGGAIHFFDDWRSDAPGAGPLKMDVNSYDVGPDFFALYGIPIIAGRTFQSGDGPHAVIVGQRLAAALWPSLDPVGRSFGFGKEQFHVIGVARELRLPSLDARLDRPEFYQPFSAGGGLVMVNMRCAGSCPDAAVLRQRILAAAPGATIFNLGPLDDVYKQQTAPPRAAASLALTFALVALLAAAGGLFSVLSYAVGQRMREFGIRTALGASPRQIRTLVLRDGVIVAGAGMALGALAAWALARGLASLEYGVTMSDPASWGLVLGVIGAASVAAAWRPARRAMRVDPVTLLRSE